LVPIALQLHVSVGATAVLVSSLYLASGGPRERHPELHRHLSEQHCERSDNHPQ